MTAYDCSIEMCSSTFVEEKGFNLPLRRGVELKDLVLCGRHARMAREEGSRTYRLSGTLQFLRKQAEERKARREAERAAVRAKLARTTIGQAISPERQQLLREMMDGRKRGKRGRPATLRLRIGAAA